MLQQSIWAAMYITHISRNPETKSPSGSINNALARSTELISKEPVQGLGIRIRTEVKQHNHHRGGEARLGMKLRWKQNVVQVRVL